MISAKYPRLVVPTVMAVLGTAIAIAGWIGTGWGVGLGTEVVAIIAALGYFVLGGRDSDAGALIGARPDERQASIGMRATALAGVVLMVVALGGFVVATATGTSTWPFALFGVVGAASYLVGLFIYRDR